MKFVVLFEDNPNLSSDIRKKNMPEHLKFLTENANKVEAAGPLNHGDGSGAGGIWVVDAADEAAVTQLIETDPFWPTGLRKSTQILRWTQVFSNGKALVG